MNYDHLLTIYVKTRHRSMVVYYREWTRLWAFVFIGYLYQEAGRHPLAVVDSGAKSGYHSTKFTGGDDTHV